MHGQTDGPEFIGPFRLTLGVQKMRKKKKKKALKINRETEANPARASYRGCSHWGIFYR